MPGQEPSSSTLAPAPLLVAGQPPVHFRRLESVDDYAGMAAVRQGAITQDKVDLQSSREGVPSVEDLAATFTLDLMVGHPDLLIAEGGGNIIGYAHVCWRWTEMTGERVYLHLGHVAPAWQGHGIGSTMMTWSQQRIGELVTIDEPQGTIRFASNASSTET